jgi:UDP-3-O-[3-hydroxymyristoyl] glucosamine N-acyltransferase
MPTFTIKEISALINGEANCQSSVVVNNVASLSLAQASDIACLSNTSQIPFLSSCQAGVILTTLELSKHCSKPCIIVAMVHNELPKLISLFSHVESLLTRKVNGSLIHPSAVIGKNVELCEGVTISAFVNIADNVIINNNCIIGSHCFIGEGSNIGQGTIINSNVSITEKSIIGNDCTIDNGAIVGARPYNPVKDKGQWYLSGAAGRVIIASKVTIGANTVIAKGVHGDTCIASGVKIDNLAHISHDVMIGQHSTIAASSTIGANTIIGEHCTIGSGCSISGQLTIVDDVVLTNRTTVTRSLLKVDIYSSGIIAQPYNVWRRNVARFHRLNDAIKRLRKLKTEVDELKKESV